MSQSGLNVGRKRRVVMLGPTWVNTYVGVNLVHQPWLVLRSNFSLPAPVVGALRPVPMMADILSN